MVGFIQYFIYIVIWYTVMWLFQYRISDFFYIFGMCIGTFKNVLTLIWDMFNVPISSYVLVVYSSLIFVALYSLLRKLYLTRSS